MNPVKWLVRTLLLFFLSHLSISVDALTLNHSIKDNGDVIVSSGKIFALGFFSPGTSRNRYVGIWYYQVSEKTVVWVANREKPLNDTSGILSIDSRGNLALFQTNQTLPVWSTNISIEATSNSFAKLLDSGNLVLLQNDTKKKVLWQSFDYLTNTMLPNMKIGLSLKTGLNRVLKSWKSLDDPGIGNYSVGIHLRGFPQMYLFKGSDPWWRVGSWTGKKWSGIPEMRMKYICNFSYVNNDDEILVVDGLKDASVLIRMTLSERGLMERFTWNNQAHRWVKYFTGPEDQSDFYKHCGPNGYCNPDNSEEFECKCFPGFQPKSSQEWYLRDVGEGCVRKHGLSVCGNGEGFVKVAHMKTSDTSKAQVDMSLGLKQCMEKCLRNFSCVAYATTRPESGGGIGYLTWYGDLVDARTFTDAGQDLYIRVDANELGML